MLGQEPARRVSRRRPDREPGWPPAVCAKAPDKIQVSLDLVAASLPALPDRVSEQRSPPVSREPDPVRDPGRPGDQGGVDRIREDHGQVEWLPPKVDRQAPAAADPPMAAFGLIPHYAVHAGLIGEEIGHPRLGHHDDFGAGIPSVEGCQGRQGEDRITHPVDFPDQDSPCLEFVERHRLPVNRTQSFPQQL